MAEFRHLSAVQGKRDLYPCDPRKLKVDPAYNVRDMDSKETREHVAALKESIIANGVRTPLEVRSDGKHVYVVAGHCRLAATLAAIAEGHDIKAVPCIPEPKGTNDIDRTVNLVVSNSGKPLSMLEVAKVVQRLDAYQWTHKQIADRLGWKAINTVKQHLEVQGLTPKIQQHIRDEEISATMARKVARGVDPKFAEELIAANIAENKRIKGNKPNARTKVTAKTFTRDTNPAERTMERAAEDKGWLAPVTPAQPHPASMQHIIDALEPFAQCDALNHLETRHHNSAVEINVVDVRRAAALWRKLSGHDEATPAQPTNGSAAEHASA